ncbi:hypothetical protein VB779_18955 [Haloarculaceae archaeon H-GB11]|nr:hypothetical protein [Haloarculaceae archaeon H-GB11]
MSNDDLDGPARAQFGGFQTNGDTVVVYDRDEPTAWIESDLSLEVSRD